MADSKKPGWKTSEFWLTAVYSVAALLNGSGALPFQIPLDTVVATGQAIMVYVGSRSGTKALSAYVTAKAQPVNPAKFNG